MIITEEDTTAVLDNILEHRGVKGMKWGVRKKRDSKKESKRLKKAAKNHNPKDFTNEELKHIIDRMKLEQEYVRLTTTPKTKKADGFIKALIKQNAKGAVNTAVTVGIKEAMKAYEKKNPSAKGATKAVSAVVDTHQRYKSITKPHSVSAKDMRKINKSLGSFGQ